jgi:hypothetical protein
LFGTLRYYLYYFANLTKLGFIDIFANRKKFKQFSVSVNDFKANYELIHKSKHLKTVELSDIVDLGKSKVIIENWVYRQGNMSLYELYAVSSIAQNLNPSVIFEIGTFDGRTTLHMALNTGETTRINTLDIPPEDLHSAKLKLDSGDPQLMDKRQFRIGECFINRAESRKITQHLEDSAAFDFADFTGKVGLFFVDGAHSYEYIKSDTENALKSLKEDGIILWHDYGNVIDVVNYLNELSNSLPICRINQTSIAIYSKALFQTKSKS